jgi:cell division septum initiation protein DivIVA
VEPTIPLWGSLSVGGILLGIVGWVVVAIFRGGLITNREQDRRDAQHKAEIEAERLRHAAELLAANERSRQWQEAWQAAIALDTTKTATMERVADLAEVLEAFLQSLPRLPGENSHDG